MPVPLIAAGIGAAASLIGSHNAAKAAKSAAAQQQQSVDKAQQFAQQAWQQQQQALSPYREAGQTALSNLMARQYGSGGQPGTASQNAGAIGFQNAPGFGFNPFAQQRPSMPVQPQPPMQQPGGGMPERGPELPQGPPPMQGGQMVRVQAPTGEVTMLPLAQAQQAQAKGARILG